MQISITFLQDHRRTCIYLLLISLYFKKECISLVLKSIIIFPRGIIQMSHGTLKFKKAEKKISLGQIFLLTG